MSEERQLTFKQEYGWLYEALVQLLAEYDPMLLVSIGAPSNEYGLEVDVILSHLHEAAPPDVLGKIIYDAFIQCFGSAFVPVGEQPSEHVQARFEAIGSAAWSILKRWQEGRQSE